MSISAKNAPSALIARLLAEGAPPSAVVPFPRKNAAGENIINVRIRLLSQAEEDIAFANASQYVARLLQEGKDLPWKPDDLEHNARASEILSVACRLVDEPQKPFFEHGVIDVRCFSSDELAQLMLVYANLKEEAFPALRDLSSDEFNKWVGIISEDALQHPFSFFSRTKLETFADLCARALVDARDRSETETPSSGSDSAEPGQD